MTLAAVFVAALAAVLAKPVLARVPPFTFTWIQGVVAAIALCAVVYGVRGERPPRGVPLAAWLHPVWIGITGAGAVRLLFLEGLARLPATTYAYLINFTGILTMLMSAALLRERPSPGQITGAFVALLGLGLYFGEPPAFEERTGVAAMAAGIVLLATANIAARRLALVHPGALSNGMVASTALVVGAIPLAALGLARDLPPAIPDGTALLVIVLNGVFAIALGTVVINLAIRTLRSYEASLLGSSGLVWTALLAVPLLGERPAPREIAGILVLAVGLVLTQRRGAARRAPPPPIR